MKSSLDPFNYAQVYNFLADPYYFERNGLYIGQGTAMMSRAGIFRELKGVAVNMDNRVFKLPSFHGIVLNLSVLT